MIYVKIILRDIWRSSIEWDEKITDNQFEKWLSWTRLLPKIETIRIPRCYVTETNTECRELHVFVDASEEAYSAVAYVRAVKFDNIQCAIIAAKARVSPQQPLTIPKAELQAALLGARLANVICKEHSISFGRRFLWSDSKTVLSWLNSDGRNYRPFVAFRVGEILEITNLSEWRWIPSRMNVADDATKWQRVPDCNMNDRWFKGPEFLMKNENHWPEQLPKNLNETDEERRSHHVLHITQKQEIIEVMRFSNWNRLLRT